MNNGFISLLLLSLFPVCAWAQEVAPSDPKSNVGVDRFVRRLERALNEKNRESLSHLSHL